jgi:hypothetical protein
MESAARFENLILAGPVPAAPAWIPLRSGPLRLFFEPRTAALRVMTLGGREILQNIYVAVRNANWGTVAPQMGDLDLRIHEEEFRLTFTAVCQERDIHFLWKGEVSGDAAGTLRYALHGTALTTFRTNRVGFCVLHPLQGCAGRPCMVEHIDGGIEQSEFPRRISPHQPFLQIRALTHEVWPGIRAMVRFEGDTFEMEDHRNWTDASFKTYCPPLSLPYPRTLDAGSEIRQSVTLSLDIAPHTRRHFSLRKSVIVPDQEGEDPVRFHIAGKSRARSLPHIGLGMASHGQPLIERECARLSALNLAHLRVDVRLSATSGPHSRLRDSLAAAAAQAGQISPALKLECALHLPAGTDSQTLKAEFRALRDGAGKRFQRQIARLLVFHETEKVTSRDSLERVYEALSAQGPLPFPIVGGTNAYFAELNRGHLALDLLNGVSYSLNPQVHAFDNVSLMENLAAQAETVRSAKAIAGKKRICVSPVTLRPRFNPDATGPEPPPLPGELPPQVDARQMALFAAAWTLGSLKYLSENGAFSITYYETTGWRGVMETETGSPLPERFPSLPGAVFPLYHVLADLGEFRGGKAWPVTSASPRRAEGILLQKAGHAAFLCANLTSVLQSVVLPYLPSSPYNSVNEGAFPEDRACRIRTLDAGNAEFAMREPERYRAEAWQTVTMPQGGLPWTLPPYATLRLDFEEVGDA